MREKDLLKFEPYGPFEIPTLSKVRGPIITAREGQKFWKADAVRKFSSERWCYIFGIKTTRRLLPFYIGKTRNSFEKECFQPAKLNFKAYLDFGRELTAYHTESRYPPLIENDPPKNEVNRLLRISMELIKKLNICLDDKWV